MKKVMLTGARGFIGAHCLCALVDKGFEVHAVSSKGSYNGYTQQITWHHADLHNSEHILRLMAEVRPEYLLHLAWDVTHGVYWSSLENLRWVRAGLSLLQAFIDAGGRRSLMVGSCAEYDWNYGYCTEGLTPLKPTTLYGTCKDALHKVTAAASREAGISSAWGRFFYLYGPGEHEGRLVPAVIKALLKGEEAHCTQGDQIRDYLYVKDAAGALTALLESEVEGPVNIAAGRPIVLRELIEATASQVGRPDLVRLGALTAGKDDPPLLLANTRRLNEEVGWLPQYRLQQGLQETVSWWRSR
ncbi:MAG: NAD(P)-dependent oxidoreductase [Dethiobacteria bacterium]|nr:NAD(P)-dependent oxidoreductase [Dethiobacteria bacterium]